MKVFAKVAALAPADFGEFRHAILMGNFGGGEITAFSPVIGKFIGNVLKPDGCALAIDGLWSLAFGNGGKSGPGDTLFFRPRPNNETDSLFGTFGARCCRAKRERRTVELETMGLVFSFTQEQRAGVPLNLSPRSQ